MSSINKLKVLFLSAEVAPLAKAGGLGDVAGALPKALKKLGADIRICLPFYGLIDTKKFPAKKIGDISFSFGGKTEKINLWTTKLPGSQVVVYLVRHKYFNGQEIYATQRTSMGDQYSREQEDLIRFAFFNKAALECVKYLDFRPNIIHANDWHTALTKKYIQNDAFFAKTEVVYTIHNLANQGFIHIDQIKNLNLDKTQLSSDAINKENYFNFMAQGIIDSDAITTVSPHYAEQILGDFYGSGLNNILNTKKDKLFGIINGIDTDAYNPAKDKLIAQRYDIKSLDKKFKNKLHLQKILGLPAETHSYASLQKNKTQSLTSLPVIGVVSRFVWQKGIELIVDAVEKILNAADASVETLHATSLPCQFVFLGTGEKILEDKLEQLALKYPKNIKTIIGFDEQLAHQIYAGADIFLMPSRFEPCGLGQMIAMDYGTIPIVRDTGGLHDTVKQLKITNYKLKNYLKIKKLKIKNSETGFIFKKYKTDEFVNTINKALDIYYNDNKIWQRLQKNGMREDFSWDKSAKEYVKMYKKMLK